MSGFWFGKFNKKKNWRRTPVKIFGIWYTPNGVKILNIAGYFKAIAKNGRFWIGKTGWTP